MDKGLLFCKVLVVYVSTIALLAPPELALDELLITASVATADASPLIPALKERIAEVAPKLESEPYSDWFASIAATGSEYGTGIDDSNWPAAADVDARIAKCAALAYALTGEAEYLESFDVALRCLERVPERAVRGNELLSLCNVAQNSALALLFARTRLDSSNEHVEHARSIVADLGEMLATNRPAWYSAFKNNWGVRQYSALATVALALDAVSGGNEKAREWLAYCDSELPKHIEFQSVPGIEYPDIAGWAEGHGYLAYSLDTLHDYVFIDSLARTDATKATLDELARLAKWSVMSSLPDGTRPDFDDSTIASFPSHIVAGLLKQANPELAGLLRWDYDNQVACGTFKDADPALALLTFDDSIEPVEPKYEAAYTAVGMPPEPEEDLPPGAVENDEATTSVESAPAEYDIPRSWFDSGTGDFVIRTGWGADEGYTMMRAESGKAHWNGGGHEHWDPLSVMFYSATREGGDWVLIDSGYPNWDDRDLTNKPSNHNMLLVDGEGPDWTKPVEGGEVRYLYMRQFDTPLPGYTGAILHGYSGGAQTGYRGVGWRRDVLLVKDDMLLIRDTVVNREANKPKKIRIPWHINMPASLDAEQGRVDPRLGGKFNILYFELANGATGSIEWVASAPVTIELRKDKHAFKYGDVQEHWVADVVLAKDTFAQSGEFTLYTLVGVDDSAGYLERWDPPESVVDIIADITDGAFGNKAVWNDRNPNFLLGICADIGDVTSGGRDDYIDLD